MIRPPQIPLDLSPEPSFTFENLMMSTGNVDAVAMVRSWEHWPSPLLYLTGPRGSGKTHIGKAWASETRQCFIDDAQDKPEAEIFAQMNLALNGDINALLIAGHPDWQPALPDLASRLKNTPRALLEEHDDKILEPILRKLFEDKGRSISRDVVVYLLKHHDRSVSSLRHIAAHLDMAAQSQKVDITRTFTAKILKESS